MTEALVIVAVSLACGIVGGLFVISGVVVLLSARHEADIRRAVRRHIADYEARNAGWTKPK